MIFALAALGGGALYMMKRKPAAPTGTASAGVRGKSGTTWLATSEPMQGPAANMSRVTIWAGPGMVDPKQTDMLPIIQYAQVGTDVRTRSLLATPGHGLPDEQLLTYANSSAMVEHAIADFGVVTA